MSLNITASVTPETKQSGDVISMVFHKGKLYTGAEGGKLIIYNQDLSIDKEIQAQYNTVNSICIFQNQLVTTGNDGLIKIWDTETLQLKQTLEGHDNEIRKLLAAGDKLYSGDMSGKVKIWNCQGSGMFTLSCVEEVWDLAVEKDVCFSVRDKDITRTQIMFRESESGETKFIILDSFHGRPPLVLLNPSTSGESQTESGSVLCYCERAGINIELRRDREVLATLQGHSKIVTCMASHKGHLYSGAYDNSVRIWDIASKSCIATGTTVNSAVHSLAVGEDGSVYAGLTDGYLVKMVLQ